MGYRFRRIHRALVIAGVVTFGAALPSCVSKAESENTTLPRTREAIVEDLEDFARDTLTRAEVTGAVIVLLEAGEPVWTLTHGVVDATTAEPVTSDTRFNVGSVSKVVTAWSVMTAVEAGQLDLDEPIAQRLAWRPGDDQRWAQITPRMLLSHTAGVRFGWGGGLVGYDGDEPMPTLEQVLDGTASAKNGGLRIVRDPGTGTLYSAAGYALAQALVEDATRKSLADHARATVFGPLEMDGASFSLPSSDVARGHNAYGHPYATLRFTAYGAAGLYASAEDLARLLAASSDVGPLAGGGGVIAPESVAEMGRATSGVAGRAFGLGWQPQSVAVGGTTHRILGHEGKNRGYVSAVKLFPRTGDGIVVVANSDRANVPLHRITCRYLTWRVGGGRCRGPHNQPEHWLLCFGVGAMLLGVHGLRRLVEHRRGLRRWRRPHGARWGRPCLAVALAAAWTVTMYSSAVASWLVGAHDQIPYLDLGRDGHWLTALVVSGCAWLGLTAWSEGVISRGDGCGRPCAGLGSRS